MYPGLPPCDQTSQALKSRLSGYFVGVCTVLTSKE